MEKKSKREIMESAINKFYTDNEMQEPIERFLTSGGAMDIIQRCYDKYVAFLKETQESAPDELKEVANTAAKSTTMDREEFIYEVGETFKIRLGEVMLPAAQYMAVWIPLKSILRIAGRERSSEELELSNDWKEYGDNLLILLEGACEEVTDDLLIKTANVGNLILEGFSLEEAQLLADGIGNTYMVPVVVTVESLEEENGGDHACNCNGECGGNCNCALREECESEGHCLKE